MNFPLYKKIGFLLGPLLFLGIILFPAEIINPTAHKVIAVAAWMICWWISEAVSISITALLPLVLFPLTGVLDIKEVAANLWESHCLFIFWWIYYCLGNREGKPASTDRFEYY